MVEYRELVITAMEEAMGGALPEDFDREAHRQGVLFDGRGTGVRRRRCWTRNSGSSASPAPARGNSRRWLRARPTGLTGLSAEQKAAVRHVWQSTDQVMLIRGGAGTGKTTMMTPAMAKLGVPVVLLAPSSDASRGELRKEGFADANTVASFLGDERDAGVGAAAASSGSMRPGCCRSTTWTGCATLAGSLDARIVLQGDPKQHKSVNRHGNMLTRAGGLRGLPVAELKEIQRQKGDYAKAVAAIRDGELTKGDAILRKLGWVVEGQGHDALVAEYARAIEETQSPTAAGRRCWSSTRRIRTATC